MNVKFLPDRSRYPDMTTSQLRDGYLITDLFVPGEIRLNYMDLERAVVGSAVPTETTLKLATSKELAAAYFAERRELGVINIGAEGTVTVGDQDFLLQNRDSLYVGQGSEQVGFSSRSPAEPAQFYLLSYPAHQAYPTRLVTKAEANRVELGSKKGANQRTIFQSICPGVTESCQLVMGFTELAEGCVWNTMPPHTHLRRSEVYMYFDLAADARVFHLMGDPAETRSLVIQDRQAVFSPSWSIHCGAGTSNYTFIWGMGGENQEFTDMDGVQMAELL